MLYIALYISYLYNMLISSYIYTNTNTIMKYNKAYLIAPLQKACCIPTPIYYKV